MLWDLPLAPFHTYYLILGYRLALILVQMSQHSPLRPSLFYVKIDIVIAEMPL